MYSSRYGSTGQYAEWMGSLLGLPVLAAKETGPEDLALVATRPAPTRSQRGPCRFRSTDLRLRARQGVTPRHGLLLGKE